MGKLIKITKKELMFDVFKFVSDATGKMRLVFEYIFSDGEFLYGTDGRRIHVAEYNKSECAEEVFYRVIKNSKRELIIHEEKEIEGNNKYPNVKLVIPKDYKKWKSFDYISSKHKESEKLKLLKSLPDGIGINIEYLRYLDQSSGWKAYFKETKGNDFSPIIFDNGYFKAIIMPVNLRN